MKTVALLIAAAGVIGGIPVANAANANIIDESESGFYVGAGLGQTKLRVTSSELDGSGDADETGFKVLGGYQFNRYFSLEAAYYQPGKVTESEDGDSISLETDIVQGFAVATLPMTERFDFIGKVGISSWDSTLTASSGFQTGRLKDNGTDLTWGVGVAAHITENLFARAEVEQTEIDAPVGSLPLKWRLRYFYATLAYRF